MCICCCVLWVVNVVVYNMVCDESDGGCVDIVVVHCVVAAMLLLMQTLLSVRLCVCS